MLLLQVCSSLLLDTGYWLIYAMNGIDRSTRTSDILALRNIFLICYQFDYVASFFLYILAGSLYRKELFQLFNFTQRRAPPVQSIQHQQPPVNP